MLAEDLSEAQRQLKQQWMRQAIQLGHEAADLGEVPIGAVLVLNDEIVGRGFNRTIVDCDPTAHAEIIALRDAATNIGNHRLVDTELYVTIEPCTMCAGALIHGRVASLCFGAREPRAGAVVSSLEVLNNSALNHQIDIVDGIYRQECAAMMQTFFKARR